MGKVNLCVSLCLNDVLNLPSDTSLGADEDKDFIICMPDINQE